MLKTDLSIFLLQLQFFVQISLSTNLWIYKKKENRYL
jgi:hypothetical protein